MSKHAVYQWIEKFKAGRSNMEDKLCSGRLGNMLNEDSIMCARNLLQENRQYTVSGMHHKMATCFLNEASCTAVLLHTYWNSKNVESMNTMSLAQIIGKSQNA